ncbi:lantibiotic dehydratase, partial [Streptomyces sp. NPDC054796]
WGHLSGGRFAALLAEDTPSDLLNTLARRPTAIQDALPAQLSFPALRTEAAHITRTPQLTAPLISLAEHRDPGPDLIALDDLAVVCHRERLMLVSRSRGQVLEAAIPHPLQIECQTPALARFLDELQRGQSSRLIDTALGSWDWGAARHLAVRPRVRYRRSILSPATWVLDHAGLPGKGASTGQWEDALGDVLTRWQIPDRVYLEYLDSRLRLDLTEPVHRALLRKRVDQPHPWGQLLLIEAEAPDAYGWCAGRAHEVITLLASTAAPRPAPDLRSTAAVRRGDRHPPGASRYLAVRLRGRPQARHALITDHLPALLDELGQPPWWLTPHDQPYPHLVLTLRLPDAAAACAALRPLGRWAQHLVETGAAGDTELVPYHPHRGRWGDGALLTAAENVLADHAPDPAHIPWRLARAVALAAHQDSPRPS